MRDVVDALRESTPQDILRFRDIAQRAASGLVSQDDAARESQEIHKAFARLIVIAMQWGIPSLLVALLALYIQWQALKESAATSEAILDELRQSNRNDELILKELRQLNEIESGSPPPAMTIPKPRPSQETANAATPINRHARRKLRSNRKPRGPTRL
ncbi:MAG: hypothetical protein ACK41C_04235 [Phenylobacterium sp.]|uniref:hypothetical protein n=1 Tax=Phenylobacterium sp. TaxID=1871053 RepID=UPI00391C4B8C